MSTSDSARVIDGTARGEREWVDGHAVERAEVFAVSRRGRAAELRDHRRRLSLLERHRLTAEQAARQSTVGCHPFERGRGGGEQIGPPRQAEVDFEHADRFIRTGVEMREQILDELAGLGPARDFGSMGSLEKDRLLIGELAYLSPAEVEVHYRGQLGAAYTVARRRRKILEDAKALAWLRDQGFAPRDIRERLGLSGDDELLAREWLLTHDAPSSGRSSG